MKPVNTFHVRPSLPERLHALEDLAYNLRWSWDYETVSLFRRLDRELWEESRHNPVLMLGTISQERLDEVSRDEAFLAHLDRMESSLREYMTGEGSWYRKTRGPSDRPLIAYFSMEFGLTECLPVYSGGLGILAGDHLKSASELGLPLVGVGLLYQKGYFRQYLNLEGWQQERYPLNDFSTLPLRPCRDGKPEAMTIGVEIGNRTVHARLWRAQIGRVPLILLDTNIDSNPKEFQDLTDELYGGGEEMRIQQELLLGIGGIRALVALNLRASVYHMNEGHCAFLTLERIRLMMKRRNLSFREALELVGASTVFTTHTPVPAGTDVFPPEMVERYVGQYRKKLGMEPASLLEWGRVRPGDDGEPFNMTALALRSACFSNGVSRLHGKVARSMWKEIWPGVPEDEVPIGHITNGIHAGSWISHDIRQLFERYLGPRWSEEPGDSRIWQRAKQIPGEELWRTHERRRERLVAFARRRLVKQLRQRGESKARLAEAEEVLDPKALTLGFARRFATYKRATLLLRDPDRLGRILNHPERPVQIIFAGKAHPRDDEGKKLIREIIHLAREPRFRRRILFLEDYDAVVSRYMVQGVDVWVNTPRRPLEASGTSGMKAAFNGVLNLSILDGWWDEAYSPRTGWAIGQGEEYLDLEYQDRIEAGTLYDLLEREVSPLFYRRGADGVPREWIAMMRSALVEHCPVFNTNRMVHDYAVQGYLPAVERRDRLQRDDCGRARALAAWRGRVRKAWGGVRIAKVEAERPDDLRVGGEVAIRIWVKPGELTADDFAVQVYMGRLDENHEIVNGTVAPIEFETQKTKDGLLFVGQVPCGSSGTHGLTVRLVPYHEDLPHQHCTRLIRWAD